MDFLPWKTFHRIVSRYGGGYRVRTLPCAEHFCVLAFAQLTYQENLRDIEACLSAQSAKLYHMGIRSPVKRSTLADANERRDWRIYAEFAQRLITHARKLYAEEDLGLGLSNTVYALDLRGNIPSFIHISDGKLHDVNVLDMILPEPAAIYVMDRAYLDFERLFGLHEASAFFVTRTKSNTDLRRVYSAPSDRVQGIICNQTVALSGFDSHKYYPHHLRRIRFKDPETGKTLIFLTNLFGPSPMTICELYKARWQVELFFKWIKQHLRIKKFYGTSENAVKMQIWTAVSVYVLVVIVRKHLALDASLYILLQVFSVTLFEKIPLNKDFLDAEHIQEDGMISNQLKLFNN